MLTLLAWLMGLNDGNAQRAHFSQFYSAPTIIGPSFAGMNRSSRIVMNYREQWPSIPGNYRTYALSFDHYFSRLNSGLGGMIMRDESGTGNLGLTSFNLLYSYDINISRSWHFKPGISAQYVYNSMNFREFTFGDQLNLGKANAPVSIEEIPSEEVDYLDMTASLLFYSSKFWFGTTAKHLLEPNQSFLGYNTFEANATMQFSGYGGVKFNLAARRARREESITATFLYKNKPRESWDQLDIGLYYTYDPFMFGGWFRGLPGINEPQDMEIEYLDAVILMVGYKLDKFSIGYSYDFTVSKLWNANTGGAHELSVVFEFNRDVRLQRRRKYESIACPSF